MNLLAKAKRKIMNCRTEVTVASAAALAVASQAFCLEAKLDKILDLIWSLCNFTGIVMVAMGAVQLIRCVIALTGGDQLQPGQLGKAIGMMAAGIAAIVLESLVGTLTA